MATLLEMEVPWGIGRGHGLGFFLFERVGGVGGVVCLLREEIEGTIPM